jgi:dynein heavy chain 1
MTGLRIEGGNWTTNNAIVPIDENQKIGSSLPLMLLTWQKVTDKTPAEDEMMIPVYLNKTRKNLIMSLRVKCGDNRTELYQKGIAIIAWTM